MAGLGLIGSAIAGAVGGAGEGIATTALEEQKAEMLRKRDEYLARLSRENKANDIALADSQAVKERERRGQFFKDNRLPDQEIEGVEVDDGGNEIGKVKGEGPADRLDQATHYARKSVETGDKGLIDMAQSEEKTLRADRELERKTDLDERKARDTERLAAIRQFEAVTKDERERQRLDQQFQAMMARMEKGEASAKDTAKAKDVRLVASAMFGFDPSKPENDPGNVEALGKAVPYVFGAPDRGPSLADVLKLQENASMNGDPITFEEAKRRAQAFSAENSGGRGGVKPPGKEPKAPAETVAKPKDKAAYEALSSGSLYVNPKDGKTYRKP